MDFLAALRALRAAHAQARSTPENTPAGRITCEANGEAMDVRVIGNISWLSGIDVLPAAEALIEARPAAVNLYIDSPGGDLFDAMALRAALDASGAAVTAQAGAIVASAAVPVYLAGAVRSAQPYTRFMVHQPRVTFFAHGTAADLVNALAEFTPTLEAALGLYRDAIASHVTADVVDGWLAENRDVWLDAPEARERGIVTEDLPEEESEEPTAQFRNLVQGLASLYGTPLRRH